MKQKYNAGFSLVEVLVAITVLAIIVVPVCTGLVMSFRMNAKTEDMMQAQLAVSSAVETLMASGIPQGTATTPESGDYGKTPEKDLFPDVTVKVKEETGKPYYTVTVTSDTEDSVSVTTCVRTAEPQDTGEEGTE